MARTKRQVTIDGVTDTIDGHAKRLNVHRSTLYGWISNGVPPEEIAKRKVLSPRKAGARANTKNHPWKRQAIGRKSHD